MISSRGSNNHAEKSRKPSKWRPSIRAYLILMNVVPLCLLFPAASIMYLHEQAAFRDAQLMHTITQIKTNLKTRGASLARSMALSSSQAVSGFDYTFLNIMVRQLVSNDKEIKYCIVMDRYNRAMAHSDLEKVGSILDSPMARQVAGLMENEFPADVTYKPRKNHVIFLDSRNKLNAGKEQVLEAVAPIYSGARLWGALRCGYSLKRLHDEAMIVNQEWAAKMKQFKITLLTMTGILFMAGVLIAALFHAFFFDQCSLFLRASAA
ncbi:MAG: hypothetical protein GY864_08045 [Desulfobacterales bacterium]|nr:hypothetical protein [Desulfobacterales bacterium]